MYGYAHFNSPGHNRAGSAAALNPNFVLTVETTAAAESFALKCQNIGVFNATINWGDGTADSIVTSYSSAALSHIYAAAGIHEITISGVFPNLNYSNTGDVGKLRTVSNLGSVGWLNLAGAFYGAAGMTSFVAGDCDTTGITSTADMFRVCKAPIIDVSTLDVDSVTTFSKMFQGTIALTLDVSSFKTSSAISLFRMFWVSAANSVDPSGFLVSSVTSVAQFISTPLATTVYDSLLVNWAAQTVIPGVTAEFDGSKYTAGSPAATARGVLTGAPNNWTITDGGAV